MPPRLPLGPLPSSLERQCYATVQLPRAGFQNVRDCQRSLSTFGYHQAKSLVYSQHGNVADVLEYAPWPKLGRIQELNFHTFTIAYTLTRSLHRTPVSSLSARSPRPSTQPISTKFKGNTQYILPSRLLSLPVRLAQFLGTKDVLR